MPTATLAALLALLLTASASAGESDDINLDSQCNLAARMVNAAIGRQDPGGLNEVGMTCFCRYNPGSHPACEKASAKDGMPAETDPVKLCQQFKSQYENSSGDVADLVSNPRNDSRVPRGGWAGGGYQSWVAEQREWGRFNPNDLNEKLNQLQGFESLYRDYSKNCDRALMAANDSTFKKWLILRPLGGSDFEVAWPGKKSQLASELKKILAAIGNLRGVLPPQ